MKKRILCFGDSLTWGSDPNGGPRLEERWPMTLQALLGDGYTVIEEGQGGRTIATDDPAEGEKNGLRYILPCLESHSPLDLVVIMLGTNDCKQKFGYSLQDIAWEMERFVKKVLTHDHFKCQDRYRVLLIAPPPVCDGIHHSWLGECFAYDEAIRKSGGLAKWYAQLAEQYGLLFLNGGDHARSSEVDGIHLDAENQKKLGAAVADFILNEVWRQPD